MKFDLLKKLNFCITRYFEKSKIIGINHKKSS
jgi:hypothetical protein